MSDIRNKRIHPMKRKVNPETLEEIEMSIVNERALLERCRLIQYHLKDNPGWLALEQDLKNELEVTEYQLNDFQNLTDKGRDYLLANRKFIRDFLDRMGNLEIIIERTSERVSELTASLNEKRQRMRISQG